MKQLGHRETLERMPRLDTNYVLYLCGVSCENLGLILRSSDVFAVEKIYYSSDRRDLKEKQLQSLSRNSKVPVYPSEGAGTLLSLKDDGYQVVALEITDASIPLRSGHFQKKTCLVIGNENSGVPEDVLNLVDFSYHIEMIGGRTSSLNVSVAASIALYEMSQASLKDSSQYFDEENILYSSTASHLSRQ